MVENESVSDFIEKDATQMAMKKMYHSKANAIIQEIENAGYIIDSEFKKTFEKFKIEKYELLKMSLKDLFVDDWQDENKGVTVKIKDSPNYKYLSGDKLQYMKRCENEPSHSCESFDGLITTLEKNGYDPKNIILVKQNDVIIDGAHRASWLVHKYGEDYEVNVLRLFIK